MSFDQLQTLKALHFLCKMAPSLKPEPHPNALVFFFPRKAHERSGKKSG